MSINLKGMNRNQISDLIRRAGARQEQLAKEDLAAARSKVQSIAKQTGFSIDELIGNTPSSPRKAKYRNPDNHEQVWGGRGKRPAWFNEALKAGKTIDQLSV